MHKKDVGFMMTLFQRHDFISAAGLPLKWKIECDALCNEDWATIAYVGSGFLPPFDRVIGVPKGGLPLANHMGKYVTAGADLTLFVDDVWTTGKSMYACAKEHGFDPASEDWIGFVAFHRGPVVDDYVYPFLKVMTP